MNTVKYYSIGEAAELLKVPPQTVQRWIREGRLSAIRFGNQLRLRLDDDEQVESSVGAELAPADLTQAVERNGKQAEATDSETKVHPKNALNDLTGKDWIQATKSVWMQRGLGREHPDTEIERQHPAPFSFTDVSRLILFFTKKNERVLDPFCGVASTLKAAAVTGRKGVGIELVEQWVELGRQRLTHEVEDASRQQIICGDARDVMKTFRDESCDFIVTSPPYWGILNKRADHKVRNERVKNGLATRYSEDPRDLANIPSYKDFINELVKVFAECRRVLRRGRYMCVVVSDFRHGAKFVPYHSDLIAALSPMGWELKGITILAQNHKKLYPYGYPYAFVSNIHHQYILVFQKEGK